MKRRTYNGESDLNLLQNFNAEAIALTDHCGYLHPGDIPHHIYSGNRSYDPVELISIWEDDQGAAAWLLVDVKYKSFDAQVRPDLRGGDFERDILAFAYERTVELMKRYNVSSDWLYADAFRGDSARNQLLIESGWKPDNEAPYVLNRMALGSVKVPALPERFSYQSAESSENAAALAEVHNGAFGPIWTPEMYRKVMESPGYEPEKELVIKAPEGTFVSFCVIRFDHLNHNGLFEPVGTHQDYQRQGFGRAIMLHGLQKMIDAGMKSASVAHFGSNEAARGLYYSLGFRPWHLLDGYSRLVLN
jgi:GNAT superfamily N-acetyltransferase